MDSETAWSSGGGGASSYESEPSYQTNYPGLLDSTGKRETPDVSFDADPSTGVPIYDSYDFGGSPWQKYGGTSSRLPVLGRFDRHRRPVPRPPRGSAC